MMLAFGVGMFFPATTNFLTVFSHRSLSRGTDEARLTKNLGFYNRLPPPDELQSSLDDGSPLFSGKSTIKRSIPIFTSQLRSSILTVSRQWLLSEVGRSTEGTVAAATAARPTTKGYTLNIMGLMLSEPNLQKFHMGLASAQQDLSIKGCQPKTLNLNFLSFLLVIICDYDKSVEDPILLHSTIVTV